jgi:ribosomal protein S18 acetylase RimI-like enzyme
LQPVEIRTATIDDLAAIFHLGEAVFTSQEVANLYRTWDEYEVTHLFNSEPEHILVADAGTAVVGFAMGTLIEKPRFAWNCGHLLWLGVDPDYARRGVGGLLFDRFREIMESEGIGLLMIDTQADNLRAIEFFRRKGFENPTAHVYMTLNLREEG